MIKENFVSAEKSEELTKNIFIGIAIMFLSLIIGGIFAWSYVTGIYTFVTTLLFMVMIYAILNLIYVLMYKRKLSDTTYNIQLGSSIYIICVTFIMMIYFGLKSYRGGGNYKGDNGYQQPSYSEYNQRF